MNSATSVVQMLDIIAQNERSYPVTVLILITPKRHFDKAEEDTNKQAQEETTTEMLRSYTGIPWIANCRQKSNIKIK